MSALTDRARQLVAEATPGPWDSHTTHRDDGDGGRVPIVIVDQGECGIAEVSIDLEVEARQPIADLIAAAPTLTIELCDAVDAAEATIDRLRAQNKASSDAWTERTAAMQSELAEWHRDRDVVAGLNDTSMSWYGTVAAIALKRERDQLSEDLCDAQMDAEGWQITARKAEAERDAAMAVAKRYRDGWRADRDGTRVAAPYLSAPRWHLFRGIEGDLLDPMTPAEVAVIEQMEVGE